MLPSSATRCLFYLITASSLLGLRPARAISNPSYDLRYSYASEQLTERPFRTKLMVLNPDYAYVKPLAPADYAGFTYEADILLGAYNDDWVTAIHLPSHRHLWWLATKHDLTAPPAIFGNWAVLGLRDGELLKVNLLSGEKVWSTRLDAFAARKFQLVGQNLLLVVTAAQTLYAIDFQNGQNRWIYDGGFPDHLSIRTTAAPTIHGQKIYYGLASGEVAAVDLESGRQLWRHNPSPNSGRFADVIGELIVLEDKLLLSRHDGLITSLSLDTAQAPVSSAWQEAKAVNTITASAYRHGKLYVGTSNGYVYAINARSGKEIWRTLIGTSLSTLTAGETQLYTTTSNGRLSTLNSATGQILWLDDLAGPIVTPPIYIGKDLYFLTYKSLYGFKIN